MKCHVCGGAMDGLMTICPYCRVRQNVDLQSINARNVPATKSLPCPRCEGEYLQHWEIELTQEGQTVEVDSCASCHGMLFNPGEVLLYLESEVTEIIWTDQLKLAEHQKLQKEFQQAQEFNQRRYIKCPHCQELMNRKMFGGTSGVLIDTCQQHGIWLDGGELRSIREWWRVGGRNEFAKNQAKREIKRKMQLQQRDRDLPENPWRRRDARRERDRTLRDLLEDTLGEVFGGMFDL